MDSARAPSARRLLRRFHDDTNGSPSVEFALASVPLSLAIIATIEIGMILFATTLMESGLRDAARFGITGATPDSLSRQERITEIVGNRTLGLIDLETADFDVVVYPTFSDIGRGETVRRRRRQRRIRARRNLRRREWKRCLGRRYRRRGRRRRR